jgi:hypothetical protein
MFASEVLTETLWIWLFGVGLLALIFATLVILQQKKSDREASEPDSPDLRARRGKPIAVPLVESNPSDVVAPEDSNAPVIPDTVPIKKQSA